MLRCAAAAALGCSSSAGRYLVRAILFGLTRGSQFCRSQRAKHLIADNLGWHNYIGGFEGEPDIEAYLASQGREGDVNRVNADVFELEKMLEKEAPSGPSSETDGSFGGVEGTE
mmetsp:Transcript_34679/g.70103  ORF Transcript_34679/g.70103 Transcript_34679/m.70103 type:complete len:114 (-) Transcript_34679:1828-2169(-)